uniref:methyltransferase family protein n=1 Tax=uncultured Draconibacterium sp. TaxID=1573823 RepID=UPI0032178068
MLVKFGNWIFHYRNFLFPVFYLTLFIPSPHLFSDHTISLTIGAIIIFLGMFTRSVTIGLVYIQRGGRNRRIHASKLVTEGIYSVCRNPMYLGNLLLLLGFGIFANSVLYLAIMFPVFGFIYLGIIKAEEAFLTNEFGEEYVEYRKKTFAIIPKLRGLGKIFANYKFNFTRVVIREYNSLFIYACGILLLCYYQQVMSLQTSAVLLVIVLVIYLVVKVLKRKRILTAS